MFKLKSTFKPCGDQPQAIEALAKGLKSHEQSQVLLGITGSGKTFTMANVIQKVNRPALVLAHNKTLAAQLYQEFKSFFPDNSVEYFVSYYDYYQPEAYVPRTDTYIEKDFAINDQIDKMRLSATQALLERRDVILVASVSCIYGLGLPEYYAQMVLRLHTNQKIHRQDVLLHLVEMQYERNDFDLSRGHFRVRGDVLEVVPANEEDMAYRIEFFDESIERMSSIDPLTGKVLSRLEKITIYPGSHYVTPEPVRFEAMKSIRKELEERIAFFHREKKYLEEQRIRERTLYDLEMIKEVGFCKGIENYSRHFSKRTQGQPPPCLLDYFPKDFMVFIDESHQTIPQLHAMYNGDQARKKVLIDYGFRLPSAYDNRPLKFEEIYQKINQVIYVSATPGIWEIGEAKGKVVQQIIRPTHLLDPEIIVRPAKNQVDDVLEEIRKEKGAVLVTTLTKKLAEELTKYLTEIGVKAKYLHSEVDTLERIHIIKELRMRNFDVLVGINLLREGLDIPEVSLVAILDADKEGFLRSETSLIQTCGRASRNVNGRVIMYADTMTKSIQNAIKITSQRREKQKEYNQQHHVSPISASKQKPQALEETFGVLEYNSKNVKPLDIERTKPELLEKKIRECQTKMKMAAQKLDFEEAAYYRDQLRYFESLELIEIEPKTIS
jgi:excinuclease ABC subunit B